MHLLRSSHPIARSLWLTATILAIAALPQLHCGGEERDATSAAQAEVPQLTATEAIAAGAVADRFPDDGLRIEQEGDLVTVFARSVPRFDVLERLAVRNRFELDDWSDEDPIVDVFVEDVALEVALARLIEPTPYRLSYERDADSDTNRIRHLEMGTPPEKGKDDERRGADSGAAEDRDGSDAGERPRRRYRRASAEETRAALEAREVRQEQRRQEALAESESADEAIRLDAIETGLDAGDPESRDRLLDLALGDPSPTVRAAAAAELSFGDAPIGLVRALDDPDPRVVIPAIEALSWLRDREARDAIATLVDHPNPDVATAAQNGLLDSRAGD